jgi:hypothetical protein
MGPFGRGPLAPACATVALLAGCGAGWQLGPSQSQPNGPVGADAANEDVDLWDYPAGGSPVKVITGQSAYATGVVVSVGKKR